MCSDEVGELCLAHVSDAVDVEDDASQRVALDLHPRRILLRKTGRLMLHVLFEAPSTPSVATLAVPSLQPRMTTPA